MPADVSQLNRFGLDLRNASKIVAAEVKVETLATGDRILSRARSSAPYKTGDLRDSIKLTEGGSRNRPSVSITAGEPYAPFQEFGTESEEFGTTRIAPRPFMGPALEAEIEPYMRSLDKIMADIL